MITVIVPTRGRPKSMAALDHVRHQTCALDTHFLFCVDDDDPELRGYAKAERDLGPWSKMIVGPRRRLGPTLNYWADVVSFLDMNGVVGFMGDDHRPRTASWDVRVAEVLRSPGVAYGDDLFQRERLPTAVFIHAQIIRHLHFMVPPGLIHLYLDDFWLELGRATRLCYLDDVVIEHLHPQAGKAAWDAGYAEVNSFEQDQRDHAVFDAYVNGHWHDDVRLLRASLPT